MKSLLLSPWSLNGLRVRCAEVVFDSTPVGPEPAKSSAAPYPTKSMTPAALSQSPAQPRALWFETRATLPAVPLIAMVPVASGVGRAGAPVLLPAASATR